MRFLVAIAFTAAATITGKDLFRCSPSLGAVLVLWTYPSFVCAVRTMGGENWLFLTGYGFVLDVRAAGSSAGQGQCIDDSGRAHDHGNHYMPKSDACKFCVCDNGSPRNCKIVLCSPPKDCKSFQVGRNCCEYTCLDDTFPVRTSMPDELMV